MGVLRSIITRFGIKLEEGKLTRGDAKVAGLKRQLRYATREARKFSRAMNGVGQSLKMAALYVAGGALVDFFTTGYAKGADNVAKFGKASGLATNFLQRFYYAMELGGATAEDSQKGIKKFAKVVNDAKLGLKSAQRSFTQLGIDPKKIQANEEGILMISDAFQRAENKGKRYAVAQELFGRAAEKLIPGLEAGRKKLAQDMADADKLGRVLTKKQLADAEAFNDELMRSKSAFLGLRNNIAKDLLPALTAHMKRWTEWYKTGHNAQKLMERIRKTGKRVAVVLAYLVTARALGRLKAFVMAVRAGYTALRLMGWAAIWAKAKVALFIALFAAIALIAEDIYVFTQGGQSLIGKLIGDWRPDLVEPIRRFLIDLKNGTLAFLAAMGRGMRWLWRELEPIIMYLAPELRELGREVKKLGQDIARDLGPPLEDLWHDIIKPAYAGWLAMQKEVARRAVQFVKIVYTELKPALSELWHDVIKPAVPYLKQAMGFIVTGAMESTKWFFRLLPYVVRFVGLLLRASIRGATMFVRAIRRIYATWKWLFGGVKSGWQTVSDVISPIIEGIRAVWDRVAGAIEGKLQSILLVGTIVWTALTGVVSGAMTAIQGLFTGAAEKARAAWEKAADAIKGAWEKARGRLGRVVSAVKGLVGKEDVRLNLSPTLAQGIPGTSGNVTHVAGGRSVVNTRVARVAKLELNVHGAPNMTPEQFRKQTAGALNDAMSQLGMDIYRDVRSET